MADSLDVSENITTAGLLFFCFVADLVIVFVVVVVLMLSQLSQWQEFEPCWEHVNFFSFFFFEEMIFFGHLLKQRKKSNFELEFFGLHI